MSGQNFPRNKTGTLADITDVLPLNSAAVNRHTVNRPCSLSNGCVWQPAMVSLQDWHQGVKR